jgi:hypothetical protein
MALCTWRRAVAPVESRPLADGEGLKTMARARRGVEELDLGIKRGGGSP